MTSLSPTFWKKLTYSTNFSANNVSFYKIIVLSQKLIHIIQLNDITFDNEKLLKIIQSLDANKAHGSDGISIRMQKLSSPPIIKPLSIIFQNCMISGIFPDDWKKGNNVPVHKKNIKQLVNYYRPESLLPICSKIFEKLIFGSILLLLLTLFNVEINIIAIIQKIAN